MKILKTYCVFLNIMHMHCKHALKIFNIANQNKVIYRTKNDILFKQLFNINKKISFTSKYLVDNKKSINYNNIIINRKKLILNKYYLNN